LFKRKVSLLHPVAEGLLAICLCFYSETTTLRLSDLAIYRCLWTVSNKHISAQFGETEIVKPF